MLFMDPLEWLYYIPFENYTLNLCFSSSFWQCIDLSVFHTYHSGGKKASWLFVFIPLSHEGLQLLVFFNVAIEASTNDFCRFSVPLERSWRPRIRPNSINEEIHVGKRQGNPNHIWHWSEINVWTLMLHIATCLSLDYQLLDYQRVHLISTPYTLSTLSYVP